MPSHGPRRPADAAEPPPSAARRPANNEADHPRVPGHPGAEQAYQGLAPRVDVDGQRVPDRRHPTPTVAPPPRGTSPPQSSWRPATVGSSSPWQQGGGTAAERAAAVLAQVRADAAAAAAVAYVPTGSPPPPMHDPAGYSATTDALFGYPHSTRQVAGSPPLSIDFSTVHPTGGGTDWLAELRSAASGPSVSVPGPLASGTSGGSPTPQRARSPFSRGASPRPGVPEAASVYAPTAYTADADNWRDVWKRPDTRTHFGPTGVWYPEPPPGILHVAGGKSGECDGWYRLVPGESFESMPVWRRVSEANDAPPRWMYSSEQGYWFIAGSKKSFPKGVGWVCSAHPHGGRLPHNVADWEQSAGAGADPAIAVTAGPPAKSRRSRSQGTPQSQDPSLAHLQAPLPPLSAATAELRALSPKRHRWAPGPSDARVAAAAERRDVLRVQREQEHASRAARKETPPRGGQGRGRPGFLRYGWHERWKEGLRWDGDDARRRAAGTSYGAPLSAHDRGVVSRLYADASDRRTKRREAEAARKRELALEEEKVLEGASLSVRERLSLGRPKVTASPRKPAAAPPAPAQKPGSKAPRRPKPQAAAPKEEPAAAENRAAEEEQQADAGQQPDGQPPAENEEPSPSPDEQLADCAAAPDLAAGSMRSSAAGQPEDGELVELSDSEPVQAADEPPGDPADEPETEEDLSGRPAPRSQLIPEDAGPQDHGTEAEAEANGEST
eukprot:TRINITY_DN8004_c0_g1_i1.p1 TRINITY_DN8004_c0_g1~~TRINITY_DN8004_c0_g1_i1.p1  ORF type:complete len:747 (+),score=155.31 TRINITY_DN8004_c0_g1_i1:64-2241(+)